MDNRELEKSWSDPESRMCGLDVQNFLKKWLKGLNDGKLEKTAVDGKYYLLHNGTAVEVTVVDEKTFQTLLGTVQK